MTVLHNAECVYGCTRYDMESHMSRSHIGVWLGNKMVTGNNMKRTVSVHHERIALLLFQSLQGGSNTAKTCSVSTAILL